MVYIRSPSKLGFPRELPSLCSRKQANEGRWYWWADAPVKKSSSIYAHDVATKDGPPSVKYRGIFINDEAPALSGWVHEKIGPHYNVEFYKKVFELLLRLKVGIISTSCCFWFNFYRRTSSGQRCGSDIHTLEAASSWTIR